MNITTKQWYQIVSGIVSSLITAAALFTTLFGPDLTPKIIAVLGIVNLCLNSVGVAMTTQTAQVNDVLAMPGVEKISVNEQANQTLAQIAVDPKQDKIAPTSDAMDSVVQTAVKG